MADTLIGENRPGNGHIEPCRDLKSLQNNVEKLSACVDVLKNRSTPWKVFVGFAGGMVLVTIIFITFYIASLGTIAKKTADQERLLYKKIDDLAKEVVNIRVNQERFSTIQEQIITALKEYRQRQDDLLK